MTNARAGVIEVAPLIGFCFLIKTAVDHLPLWSSFLDRASPGEFSCYVHAKTPAPVAVPEGAWVDPNPLPTAWGDLSLVLATRRLFEKALADGCTAFVLVSGDMLPLQSFAAIRDICLQTRICLQPRDGLNDRQRNANNRRYEAIAPWFDLPKTSLRKQNMFFSITSADYLLLRGLDVSRFPLEQLADEYFWVNGLIRCGLRVNHDNFIYCNPDPTRTQALPLQLDRDLVLHCARHGYRFIRKVKDVDPRADECLRQLYAGNEWVLL